MTVPTFFLVPSMYSLLVGQRSQRSQPSGHAAAMYLTLLYMISRTLGSRGLATGTCGAVPGSSLASFASPALLACRYIRVLVQRPCVAPQTVATCTTPL
jgi:membrane-associated phospholipid phosphatase